MIRFPKFTSALFLLFFIPLTHADRQTSNEIILVVPVQEVYESKDEITSLPETDTAEHGGLLINTRPGSHTREREAAEAKLMAEIEKRRANLGELEYLVTESFWCPQRERLLPYRFSDASKLQAMLSDPEWEYHWRVIACSIGMIADKKTANQMIKYIKDDKVSAGLEHEANTARFESIRALQYVLIDQNVPEVIAFLEELTDLNYVKSLNFSIGFPPGMIRSRALITLANIASNDSIRILEKEHAKIKALTKEAGPYGTDDTKTNIPIDVKDQMSILVEALELARRKNAGVPPEKPKSGDAVP